jgi:adenylate cyclase
MTPAGTRAVGWAVLLTLPLVGLVVLLVRPGLDVPWEHHPAHFWLVLVAAVTNVVLAVVTGDAARRRGDARVFLVSLAFLAGAGFLALHALATPGVLLEAPNTGFVIATPVGLLVAAAFAAASALDLGRERSLALVRRAGAIRLALLAAMAAWAAVSLVGVAPLDDPLPVEEARGPLAALAVPGIALYAFAALRYVAPLRRRPTPILLGVVTAFVLLAQAMLAIALARNWHATWWEWHLLMLVAFAAVAYGARREWREERFADLYLPETAGGVRDASVLFADLEGFTAFSERATPDEVAEVVNTYLERMLPLVAREHGGEVDKLIGDAIMVTFNTRGDQPDHPLRAARAAFALQRAAADVARAHPGWPRFRIGVNSGPARLGVVGAPGKRDYTALGDTVNLAARLQAEARTGGVVIGGATYDALPDGTRVEPLGGVRVKGKEAPVEAYVLVELPPDGGERGDRLEREDHDGEDERGVP